MIIKSSTQFRHQTHTYRQSSLTMIYSHTTEKFFLMTLSPDWEEDSYKSNVIKKYVCGETGENEIYKATEIALCKHRPSRSPWRQSRKYHLQILYTVKKRTLTYLKSIKRSIKMKNCEQPRPSWGSCVCFRGHNAGSG